MPKLVGFETYVLFLPPFGEMMVQFDFFYTFFEMGWNHQQPDQHT